MLSTCRTEIYVGAKEHISRVHARYKSIETGLRQFHLVSYIFHKM